MASFVHINEEKLQSFVSESPNLDKPLQATTESIVTRANNASAGFRTGIYHRPDGETVGNTQPTYKGDVKRGKKGYVGIVYTGNYSAMKDNYENNTLLKSL